MIRDHGQAKKYYHDVEGYNGRLDAIQAAFLRIKLKHLPKWNEQRRDRAQDLWKLTQRARKCNRPARRTLGKSGLSSICNSGGRPRRSHRPSWPRRTSAQAFTTRFPLHLQKAYGHLGYKEGDFPVSERLAKEIVSLPMYPNLTEEQQHRVCDKMRQIFAEEVARRGGSPVLVSS